MRRSRSVEFSQDQEESCQMFLACVEKLIYEIGLGSHRAKQEKRRTATSGSSLLRGLWGRIGQQALERIDCLLRLCKFRSDLVQGRLS